MKEETTVESNSEIRHEYEMYLDECLLGKTKAIPFDEWIEYYRNGDLYLLD